MLNKMTLENKEEFLYFFESNNTLFENYKNTYEGNFEDYRISRIEGIVDPFANCVLVNKDLDLETIGQLKDRFIKENLTPSFSVMTNSKTYDLLIENGATSEYEIIWMKCDLETTHIDKNIFKDIEIKTFDTSNNKDYLEVYKSAYLENDGIGFALDDSYLKTYEQHTQQERFEEKVLIAYNETGQPVCISTVGLDSKKPNISILHSVGTKNNARRKGYARKLMTKGMSISKDQNITKMYLGTIDNSPMQTFYESLGFKPLIRTSTLVFKNI